MKSTRCVFTVIVMIIVLCGSKYVRTSGNEGDRCILDHKLEVSCFQAEEKPWTMLLGIGPAKTGTTAYAFFLGGHRDVAAGIGERSNTKHCYGETWFFDHPEQVLEGWGRYLASFPHEAEGRKFLLDKSPSYSWTEPSAYYAGLFLSGTKTKLIFTYRDRLERDVSEFFFRKRQGHPLPTYDAYLSLRIKHFRKWSACREKAFSERLKANNSAYVGIESLSMADAGIVVSGVYERCRGFLHKPIPLQASLFERNLYRWALLFGRENILCVHTEDLRADSTRFRRRVERFLNIDPKGWANVSHPRENETSMLSARMKILFGENATAMTTLLKEELQSAVSTYAPPTASESELFRDLCLKDREKRRRWDLMISSGATSASVTD